MKDEKRRETKARAQASWWLVVIFDEAETGQKTGQVTHNVSHTAEV